MEASDTFAQLAKAFGACAWWGVLGGVLLAFFLVLTEAFESFFKQEVALDQLFSALVHGALLGGGGLWAGRTGCAGGCEEFAESAIYALFEGGLVCKDAVEMVIACGLEDAGPHTFDTQPPCAFFAEFGALLLEGGKAKWALKSEATGDFTDEFSILLNALVTKGCIVLEDLVTELVEADLIGFCVGLEHGVEVGIGTAVWDIRGAVGEQDLAVGLVEIFGGAHCQDKAVGVTDVFFELRFGEAAVSVLAR